VYLNHYRSPYITREMYVFQKLVFFTKLDYIFLQKCQNPILSIENQASSFLQPIIKKRNDLISLIGITILNCATVLSNKKEWLIYEVNQQTGIDTNQIQMTNNPTINYAQVVIQPQTLVYGLYHFIYTVTMILNSDSNSTSFSGQVSTYVQIEPSGIILSSLSLSQGIFGGTIEISRGQQQPITFNPYLNSYDLDSILTITTLNFKYSCQIIDSNVPKGYPQLPGTNISIFLVEMKLNNSLQFYDDCFNSTGNSIILLLKNVLLFRISSIIHG